MSEFTPTSETARKILVTMGDGSQHSDTRIVEESPPIQPHSLTLNAHQVILDLVEALESLLKATDNETIVSPYWWNQGDKALKQGLEFLGVKE